MEDKLPSQLGVVMIQQIYYQEMHQLNEPQVFVSQYQNNATFDPCHHNIFKKQQNSKE